MTDGNTIRSVSKAMELLQILSNEGRPMSLTDITKISGYPKSTVFGLLTTMRSYDVIYQTRDGRYTLGFRLFEKQRRQNDFPFPGDEVKTPMPRVSFR